MRQATTQRLPRSPHVMASQQSFWRLCMLSRLLMVLPFIPLNGWHYSKHASSQSDLLLLWSAAC